MIEIPGYSILGKIGQGGMASVYRARQVLLDRDVALKVMASQLAQDEAYAQRFLQEARMLAALNHPNVVQVYDVGVTPGGLHYFSMALLPGGDFAQRMRDGLSETELLRVLVAVATALGFAHARGYVHRDVTPGNILFDAHDTPVLTDFGIARALSAVSRLTGSGMSIGTSHYMSPEQARGGAEIDHRSDIYGLGVLCYEAVVGETPFNGEDSFAVAFAHVNDPVPRLPEEVARWQPLIDKAMAKDPAQRYQSCAEFIEALKEIAPAEFSTLRPVAAPPPPRRTPPPSNRPALSSPASSGAARGARKVPMLAIIGTLLVLVALLGAGIAWWLSGGGAAPAPQPAVADVVKVDPKPVVAPAPADDSRADAAVVDEGLDEAPAVAADAAAGELDADAQAALEAAMAHTVRDPVLALLEAGRANIAAGRLTSPPVTNALDRYKLALRIEPDNADAGRGIANVAQVLLDQAQEATGAEDPTALLGLLQQAEAVSGEHPAAAAQLAVARTLRESRAQRDIDAGAAAILALRRDAAVAAYEQALRIAPGLAAAERGLAEAKKVGNPGWIFRDVLAGGEKGPELVVVRGKLALARRETSRGEFAAFWAAEGASRFAAAMPNCRDRNTGGVFGGSRSRTWQKPDIEQNDRHPVVCVSFPMAEAYAAWISAQTGKRYRLPDQSELAPHAASLPSNCSANLREARGGCNDGHAGTAPVGSFAVSSAGLFDAVGNVAEWTRDCDRGGCKERIAFGGHWHAEPGEPVALARPADTGFNTVGFRLVRELD